MSKSFSTRQAATKLGITAAALSKYISAGKVPPPEIFQIGGREVHSWTEQQIENVRKLLPKIANGRKTWRGKKQIALSSQRSVKPKPPKPKPKKSKP